MAREPKPILSEPRADTISRKYFKPASVTWWSGVALILMGGVLGIDAGYSIGGLADVIRAWTGGIGPSVLIAQGAGLIGIRGAL